MKKSDKRQKKNHIREKVVDKREEKISFFHKDRVFLLIIIGLSFFAVWPLFLPEFFFSHDGGHHIVRIAQYIEAFKDGQYIVRWLPDLMGGYGLPLFVFIPPLTYFSALLLHFVGFGVLYSYKIVMFLSITLSGITMFLFAREFFDGKGSLLAAVAYMFAPYRFVDIYVRGAMPESMAFVFIPLVFLGVKKIVDRLQIKSVLLLSISLAGLILSHNIAALIIFPVALLYGLYSVYIEKKPMAVVHLALVSVVSLGLSAFYWIPALLEKRHVFLGGSAGALSYNFRDHFVYLWQFVSYFWDYGFSRMGPGDGMSFQIGSLHILAVVIALIAMPHIRDKSLRAINIFFLVIFAVSLFLMTEWSRALWEAFPIFHFLQFPWRFLMLIVFTSAFLIGTVEYVVKSRPHWGIPLGIVILILPAVMLITSLPFDQREGGTYTAIHLLLLFTVVASFLFILWFSMNLQSRFIIHLTAATIILTTMPFWNLPLQQAFSDKPRIEQISEQSFRPDMLRQEMSRGGATFEFIPRTVKKILLKPPQHVVDVISGSPVISTIDRRSNHLIFESQSSTESEVLVNIFYFPGWMALIDGKRTDIELDDMGRMRLVVPQGVHKVVFAFIETDTRKIARMITIISSLILLSLCLMLWLNQRRKKAGAR